MHVYLKICNAYSTPPHSPAATAVAATAGVRILHHDEDEAERHHEDPHPHEDGHKAILMMFEDPHPQTLP